MLWLGAVSEAPAFVSSLHDIAVMREAIEECGGHLRIAEDARPFAERQVRRDDNRGPLVETADQVEQQLSAGLGKGQIAEFVKDDEVESCEIVRETSLTTSPPFGFQPIDEIDGGEEAPARSCSYTASRDVNGQMRLARAGAANKNDVALLGDEVAPARSRTRLSLIGVEWNVKSSMSLDSGSLAMVS
jgi:hypothetical protein